MTYFEETDAAENAALAYVEEDEIHNPENYVSEDDYWQPTPRERAELAFTDDMLMFWSAHRFLPFPL